MCFLNRRTDIQPLSDIQSSKSLPTIDLARHSFSFPFVFKDFLSVSYLFFVEHHKHPRFSLFRLSIKF